MINELPTVIHQPDFMPWIGFFDKLNKSRLLIYLDDVQFSRRGWAHRDKIKVLDSHLWLTVPVEKKNNYYENIRNIKIKYPEDLKTTHLNIIKNAYQKTKNFSKIYPYLEGIYKKNFKFLIDLNLNFIDLFCQILQINIETKFSSEFKLNSFSSERLIELLKITDSKYYLTGNPSKDYLDQKLFEEKKIEIKWHILDEKIYKKNYEYFDKNLSALDYIMNKNE